jgi:hypothetical protein
VFKTRTNNYLALSLISILIYIPLFIRKSNIPFLGVDSYYYINYIFHSTPLHVHNIAQEVLFNLFPANLVIIKLVMLLVTISCAFIFYEIVEFIKKGKGFLASAFLLTFFWFSWIFIKFENDLFGFPFVLLSLYFLIKFVYSEHKKKWFDWNIMLSLFFLFIAVLIWNFAIYFLFAFLFISKYHRLYLASSIFTFTLFSTQIISRLMPHLAISENQPIKGLIVLMFLAFLYLKDIRLQETWVAVLVFTALTFVNAKMIYITVPILLLSFVNININTSNKVKNAMIFFVLLFLCINLYQNITTYPTTKDYELISIAQIESIKQDKEIYYQWSVGYFAIWLGYDAIHYGTVPREDVSYENKIILTIKNEKKIRNCKIIDESRWLSLASC